MPSLSTRTGKISYSISGSGTPIVLLHATLHNHHDFDLIISQLSLHCQTIAVDWPWHGDSEHPSNQTASPSLFADVLEDVVATLDLPPAIFIGNSIGGIAASRLAITHPERVKGLVLVNTGGFAQWNPFLRLFVRALGNPTIFRKIMPLFVPRYMSAQSAEDTAISKQVTDLAGTVEGAKIGASIWRGFLDPGANLRERAADIKCPVLIVWGSRDQVVSLKVAHMTHDVIPGSSLEVLDTGHVVFSSKPEEFLKVASPFIDGLVKAEQNV